jgi:transcription antitermination factor NusG
MHSDQQLYRHAEDEGRETAGPERQWCAVYTYPRHEKVVNDALSSHSIEVYSPTLPFESQWKDRTVVVHVPVFPGYVFARIFAGERGQVLGSRGVVRILTTGGKPAHIPSEEIEAIRLSLKYGAHVESSCSAVVGEKVRVRSGVLKGLVGTVSQCREDRRLIVPITLIHQSIFVEVDLALLDQVDAAGSIAQPTGNQFSSYGHDQRGS